MSYFSKFQQDIKVSTLNSSIINIGAGATYSGVADSTLNVAGIQVSLFCDQNCTVYIDQASDIIPVSHWDISDEYTYYANSSFGITAQCVSSYARIRIKNKNTTTPTSTFRLQTVLCPIVEAVPRSLDEFGNLKTSIYGMTDLYGFTTENTPNGEIRAIEPIRIVGATFEGTIVDPNFWTSTVTNNGTINQANAQIVLSTNTTANGTATLNSVRRARYVANCAMLFRTQVILSSAVTNNKKRWGIGWGSSMPTITDGAYFQINGTTFSVVLLKGGIENKIDSGSFNGKIGLTFDPDAINNTYEIYWNNANVWFVIGDLILHHHSATLTTWASTMSPYIFMDNVNSNGSTTNNTLTCRVAAIRRLGSLITQPTSKYQSGTTTGVICKYGAGNLNRLIVSSATSGSILTIYDGTTTGGTVIHSFIVSFGNQGGQGIYSVDMGGLPFFNGLFFTITTQPMNVSLIYE